MSLRNVCAKLRIYVFLRMDVFPGLCVQLNNLQIFVKKISSNCICNKPLPLNTLKKKKNWPIKHKGRSFMFLFEEWQ